jgi:hypothetical protein
MLTQHCRAGLSCSTAFGDWSVADLRMRGEKSVRARECRSFAAQDAVLRDSDFSLRNLDF